MASMPRFKPGPHWWEASALTTLPPFLPLLSLVRSTFWVVWANSVVHKLHANCFCYRRWLQFINKVDSIHVESWFDSSNSAYYTGPKFIFSNINDPTTVFLYFPNVVTPFWTYRILQTRHWDYSQLPGKSNIQGSSYLGQIFIGMIWRKTKITSS